MVRVTGLEPAQHKLPGPKPGASTNSATPARLVYQTLIFIIQFISLKNNSNCKSLNKKI